MRNLARMQMVTQHSCIFTGIRHEPDMQARCNAVARQGL